MSAREWLDQLDQAREAATPGPWELDPEALCASNDTGDLLFDYRDAVLVGDHPEGVAQCAADGGLIVAAVNALPGLTAALRAVLALIDQAAERVRQNVPAASAEILIREGAHYAATVAELRSAVAAAEAVDR